MWSETIAVFNRHRTVAKATGPLQTQYFPDSSHRLAPLASMPLNLLTTTVKKRHAATQNQSLLVVPLCAPISPPARAGFSAREQPFAVLAPGICNTCAASAVSLGVPKPPLLNIEVQIWNIARFCDWRGFLRILPRSRQTLYIRQVRENQKDSFRLLIVLLYRIPHAVIQHFDGSVRRFLRTIVNIEMTVLAFAAICLSFSL